MSDITALINKGLNLGSSNKPMPAHLLDKSLDKLSAKYDHVDNPRLNKPRPDKISSASAKGLQPPVKKYPTPSTVNQKPTADEPPVNTGFKLVDVSGGRKFRDSEIYHKGFRFKTEQALKGILGMTSEKRWAVADRLWKARDRGGISNGEVRGIIADLREKGTIDDYQAKKLKEKFRAYKSGWF